MSLLEVLDSDAELGGLLVPSTGVEIVGRTVIELVTQAKFAAYVDADGGDSHTHGEPAEDLEGVVLVLFVEKRERCGISGHGRLDLLS